MITDPAFYVIAVFAFLNFIKIPPYFAFGQFNLANLSTALVH